MARKLQLEEEEALRTRNEARQPPPAAASFAPARPKPSSRRSNSSDSARHRSSDATRQRTDEEIAREMQHREEELATEQRRRVLYGNRVPRDNRQHRQPTAASLDRNGEFHRVLATLVAIQDRMAGYGEDEDDDGDDGPIPGLQRRPGESEYETLLRLDENNVKIHYSKRQIDSLPVRAWKTSDASSGLTQCSICLEDYKAGDQLRTTVCVHTFHAACLEQALKNSKKCPICRADAAK